MHGSARIELVVDELMAVKGWGADPDRLARQPNLRELAQVEPGLSRIGAGRVIGRYLVDSIEALPERFYEFEGRSYPAKDMRAGFFLELRIRTTASHEARQYRLMVLLGLSYSYDRWRKDPRLERAFLTILAEHLVQPPNDQTAP
jgi:hypothetical protein